MTVRLRSLLSSQDVVIVENTGRLALVDQQRQARLVDGGQEGTYEICGAGGQQ
jgi:hypothetical protein